MQKFVVSVFLWAIGAHSPLAAMVQSNSFEIFLRPDDAYIIIKY